MSRSVILGDWGTSRLRLWRVDDGVVTARAAGPGIGALTLSPTLSLSAALAPLLVAGAPTCIVLCGMAGARGGLAEVPYLACPADSAAWARAATRLSFDGIPLVIGAGLACHDAGRGADDVMRGEETQAFGLLARTPHGAQGEQLLVLPGTHSKWVWLSGGRIIRIHTFLTGELFGLLGASSLLAGGDSGGASSSAGGFAAGLARAAVGGLTAALFEARSARLRQGRSTGWAREFLSGLLIGHELREVADMGRLPPAISIIAEPNLANRYADALGRYGMAAICFDGEDCAVAGLEILNADD